MITEKQIENVVARAFETSKEEIKNLVIGEIEPLINGLVLAPHTIDLISDQLVEKVNVKIKKAVSSRTDTEEFIDRVVERIKRKQL